MVFAVSARCRASSSIRPPRATLTTNAVGFIERELVVRDHAEGLGGARHVDRDEVGTPQQVVEGDELDPELLGASRRDVGVVGDDLDAEGLQALRDERADAAEADDPDGLLVELDARVGRALPGAVGQRRVRGRDVAGERQDVPDGELGGGDDVRRRRVHHHHTGGGRRLDVDVVEADTGTGDDLEVRGRGDRLGIDLGGGTHQHGIRVGEGRQERGPVGAVHVPDLEVGPEGVDRCGREFFGDQDDRLRHSCCFLTRDGWYPTMLSTCAVRYDRARSCRTAAGSARTAAGRATARRPPRRRGRTRRRSRSAAHDA